MMDVATWRELAERCRKAMGPDDDTDRAIHKAIRDESLGVPDYTKSLDDIVSLIERELPDMDWRVGKCSSIIGFYDAQLYPREDGFEAGFANGLDVEAAKPALALSSVFCLAMAHVAEQREQAETERK